jgi:hypothetical protein
MALRVPHVDDPLRRPVLVVASLAMLLLFGGLSIGGFFLFRPEQEPATAARIATDAFVSRLIAGNYGGAYDQLCADTRRRVERDDFIASIGGRPAVRSYQVDKIERSGAGFTINVTFADPSGAAAPQVFRVIEDRGAWRICGDPLPAT